MKLIKILQWFALALGIVMCIFPETFGHGMGPAILMTNFITTSVSWAGKENFDYMIKPMFVGKSPLETEGIRILPNVQDKQLLNYFSPVAKLLKAYAVAFSGVGGVTYSQRTLNVYKMKGEAQEDATVFFHTVYSELLKKGNWNELSPAGQEAELYRVLTGLFMKGINSDVFRQYWLSDTVKSVVTSGVDTGVADTDYNAYDGIWKKIFANAATSPTSTQIKRCAVTDGAVAQVQTVTMSVDASGTGNLLIDGVNYLITRDTDATTTFTGFKTLYSAALLLRGFVLSGTSTLIVTSSIAGRPFNAITFTSVSGTVAFTIAATTPNTAPTALAAGESVDILEDLWKNSPAVLKQVPKQQKAFYVGDLVYDNYMEYFEDKTSTEFAIRAIIDGQEYLAFRGIPLIKVGWDYHLDADFAHVAGSLWAYPHRVIYSALDNLILGIDGMNEFNSFDFWFNKDLEQNRMRFKCIMGPEYAMNNLMAVAY
jgi:hypothetical protein